MAPLKYSGARNIGSGRSTVDLILHGPEHPGSLIRRQKMGRHIPANPVTGLNEETLRHYQVMVDLAPYNQLDFAAETSLLGAGPLPNPNLVILTDCWSAESDADRRCH